MFSKLCFSLTFFAALRQASVDANFEYGPKSGSDTDPGYGNSLASMQCVSDRLKEQCEEGRVIFKTKEFRSLRGCEEDCRRTVGCQSFIHTKEHDCLMLKLKPEMVNAKDLGFSHQDVKVPGPKLAAPSKKDALEDCVEFHFEECEAKTPLGEFWSMWSHKREHSCVKQCENPDTSKCNTFIVAKERRNVSDDCFQSESPSVHEITNHYCNIQRGTVNKRGSLEHYDHCLSHAPSCKRGACDYGHLEEIKIHKAYYSDNEKDCMLECWGYWGYPTGSGKDCTHYKWIRNSRGRCIFYYRKNKDDKETNYKCNKYSAANELLDESMEKLITCKVGGMKYYKPTKECETMCSTVLGDEAHFTFPVAFTLDVSNSQKDDRDKVNQLIETMNIKKANSYLLTLFGTPNASQFPLRNTYEEFKKDLDNVTFLENITSPEGRFFKEGLKVVCENAAEKSIIVATIDEYTDNLELEAEIAKCLLDKKATLFIALNPTFEGHPDSHAAYKRLSEGSGGKVIDISADVSPLANELNTVVSTICNCMLYADPLVVQQPYVKVNTSFIQQINDITSNILQQGQLDGNVKDIPSNTRQDGRFGVNVNVNVDH